MPPRKSRSSIPRSLDPSLISPPALYKAGMYSELQARPGPRPGHQLILRAAGSPGEQSHANTAGLELTVEDKALSAIRSSWTGQATRATSQAGRPTSRSMAGQGHSRD